MDFLASTCICTMLGVSVHKHLQMPDCATVSGVWRFRAGIGHHTVVWLATEKSKSDFAVSSPMQCIAARFVSARSHIPRVFVITGVNAYCVAQQKKLFQATYPSAGRKEYVKFDSLMSFIWAKGMFEVFRKIPSRYFGRNSRAFRGYVRLKLLFPFRPNLWPI